MEQSRSPQLNLGLNLNPLLVELDLRQHPPLHLGLARLITDGLFTLLLRQFEGLLFQVHLVL